ncbi:MAG: sigma-70 family RNA polymerase sigma factor [Syntrophomonadaceae bacterium]|nr:sigma-70 family RNA polymerase sigma factor [Syntrophomonadaceae bacterium]MDD3270607.1 sigma-70 family RNA polymerase sigma factor [Syntrophomonadaceae bacterium]MDD3897851.1 sigma-70 family RNA polymerase sigma factor [Syntrophomonadaceae bacterium]MDD4561787.1 sigma-70 family RNA polymerase sigma factor [Syntrophomonadaceae bacterium]
MVMLTEAEETTLIAQANDDDSTFTELYNDYFLQVHNYVHYRVVDFHAADDLVSQIFEKLFAKLQYYQPEKAVFSTWLFSIARNTITDYYRSQKRRQVVSLDISAELIDSEPDPIDVVIFNETQQHLQKALASLSQRERDIIALKFWSGCSNKEIAGIIGISESNSRVILFRAMRRLRIILERQGLNICG